MRKNDRMHIYMYVHSYQIKTKTYFYTFTSSAFFKENLNILKKNKLNAWVSVRLKLDVCCILLLFFPFTLMNIIF
jgi:hypothetical protein